MGRILLSLERIRETSAKLIGSFEAVPLKMTSSMLEARRLFVDCSPKTQRTASAILLFPVPLGPTIAVTPGSKFKVVLSANDLKPMSSNDLKYIIFYDNIYKERIIQTKMYKAINLRQRRVKVYHRIAKKAS